MPNLPQPTCLFACCPRSCSYLPLEVLNDDLSQLHKADMFSLGATLLELATRVELPTNGPLYQDLRAGKLPLLPTCTQRFAAMIRLGGAAAITGVGQLTGVRDADRVDSVQSSCICGVTGKSSVGLLGRQSSVLRMHMPHCLPICLLCCCCLVLAAPAEL